MYTRINVLVPVGQLLSSRREGRIRAGHEARRREAATQASSVLVDCFAVRAYVGLSQAVKSGANPVLRSVSRRMSAPSRTKHMDGNSSTVMALIPRASRVFGENLGRCDRRSEGG